VTIKLFFSQRQCAHGHLMLDPTTQCYCSKECMPYRALFKSQAMNDCQQTGPHPS
jgi:hypothetical protein